MKLPVDIRFIGIERSPALEYDARQHVHRLERSFPQVIAWRVAIGVPHRAHRQGREFAVRLDVTLPGEEITVDRGDDDAGLALRSAFAVLRRRLQEIVRRRRGEVKEHAGVEPAEHPGEWRDEEGP